jgi:hypothetical protein
VTLAADASNETAPTVRLRTAAPAVSPLAAYEAKPVEFWPTAAIAAAVKSGDIGIWQRIVVALRRDPYGRTARQVEEVLAAVTSPGITKALAEVLAGRRAHLEADERAVVGAQVRALLDRSGLNTREFASRIGVSADQLTSYLDADVSPSAAQMIRMQRLAERFAKMKAHRAARPTE